MLMNQTKPSTMDQQDAAPASDDRPGLVQTYATKRIDHELDPKGDTILVLRPSSEPFAVWEGEGDVEWPNALVQTSAETGSTEHREDGEQTACEPSREQEDGEQQGGPEESAEVLFRLSSRHLVLASDYFQKLFEGNWKESGASSFSSPTVLTAEDWSEEALLVVMNTIHGRSRRVPKEVTLEFLAELSVIVDYYQCHEVMDMYGDRWLPRLPEPPTSYKRDLILRLFVSSVFFQSDVLQKIYNVILTNCRGPIQTLGLPISPTLIDILDVRRQTCIGRLLHKVHFAMEQLVYGENWRTCGEECRITLLGSSTETLIKGGLLFRQPTHPYYGYSWRELVDHLCSSLETGGNCRHIDGFRCSVPWQLEKLIEYLDPCRSALPTTSTRDSMRDNCSQTN